MARGPRVDGSGFVHHLTLRGVARCDVFLDDADREEMLRRLEALARELGFFCLAWALMSNHIHLVIQAADIPLRRLMARLATGYAMYFNRRHGRVGHLFQNRYWSQPVENEEALEAIVAYVNQNPLKAGLVGSLAELARYRWSGYGSQIGAREPRSFEHAVGRRPGFRASAGSDTASCGAGKLDELIEEVCLKHGASVAALREGSRSRVVSRARAQVVEIAVRRLGLAPARVAKTLRISGSAVSQILWRR